MGKSTGKKPSEITLDEAPKIIRDLRRELHNVTFERSEMRQRIEKANLSVVEAQVTDAKRVAAERYKEKEATLEKVAELEEEVAKLKGIIENRDKSAARQGSKIKKLEEEARRKRS